MQEIPPLAHPTLGCSLAHVPVPTAMWAVPHLSDTTAFNAHFLLPLILSLGHLWLLLLGTA